MGDGRYLVKRLLFIPVGAAVVYVLSFFVVNLIPSDPAQAVAGSSASSSVIERTNHSLGLDHSVWVRFWLSVKSLVLHFSLGHSYFSKRSVLTDIWYYLPSTLELVILSLIVAVVVGVAVGSVGAYFRGRPPDRLANAATTVLQVVPDFVLGLVLTYLLFYRAGVLPANTGQLGLLDQPSHRITGAALFDSVVTGNWTLAQSAFTHAILPVLALGVSSAAFFAKITRSVLGETLQSQQVEFARACGLGPRTVFAYAFTAARSQIITYTGLMFAGLIGGDVIVERLFSWNGIGQFSVERIEQLDLPEMQGIILVLALLTLSVLLIVDLVVARLDPRITHR